MTASTTLNASPSPVNIGSPVTLTLQVSESTAASYRLRAGSSVPVQFGDGAVGAIPLISGPNGLFGRATHVYAAAGTYTATSTLAAIEARAGAPQLTVSATVVVVGASRPGPPHVLSATLTWPDGSTQLHLSSPATAPQPVALVRVSSAVTVVAQWSVDGTPTQSVRENATANAAAQFTYSGTLPPSGSHSVGFTIISPAQPAPNPPAVAYQYSAATPRPTPPLSYQMFKFNGFSVTNLHVTESGNTYSGTGRAHVANLQFQVGFTGLQVSPDSAASTQLGMSVGDVTAGTASYVSPNSTNQSGPVGRHVPIKLGSPCTNSNLHLSIVSGLFFTGQIGAFQRDGYTFYLMAVQLEPINQQSLATFCWPAPGVETADAAQTSGGFNTAFAGSQLILELASINISDDGAFDDTISGDKVGDYRLGYTPFVVEPTSAQSLQLRFGDSEGAPHATFNNTPAVGSILQQVVPNSLHATCTTCLWDPAGIDAVFSIDPGQSIYPAAPANFKLTISQSTLNIQGSTFLGGTMSGTFAAGQPAPIKIMPVHEAMVDPGPVETATNAAYDAAMQSAASYNNSATSSSGSHFVRAGSPISAQSPGKMLTASSPSGQFSGQFTAIGDLIATATGVSPYVSVGYTIAPSHGSLYVPGGQYSYPSSFEFGELFMGALALSPLWSSTPHLDYSQPSTFVIGGVERYQSGIIGQFQGSVSQKKSMTFAGNAAMSTHPLQTLTGPASPIEAKPAFPWPGLYVDAGSVQTPYTGTPSSFADTTKGEGFGFAFTDGSGNSALFSLMSDVRSTIGSFSLDMQLFNVEIVDDGVVQSSFWGVVQIPAPIAAALPVVVQQVNNNGKLGAYFIPSGVKVPLTAWNASMVLDEPTTVGQTSIAVSDGALSVPNYSGSTHVQGALLASGRLQNDQLMPLAQQPTQRVAGLDFTAFSFGFPDQGNANVPVRIDGSGSIAGWSASQQILTLVSTGSGYAPPSGYHFTVSQSAGVVSMNADIAYSGNDAWNGSGKIGSNGFLNASFGLHVDDSNEQAQIGLNVSGGSGSSSSGLTSMTNVKGGARFARNNGSLQAMAFGATLNVSSFSTHAAVLYHTSFSDPLVQSVGGTGHLQQIYGGQCQQAWCFSGSMSVALDSSVNLSGELDGVFNNGFGMFADGTLTTPLVTVNVQAQLAFYNDGEWDVGVLYTPIPVFGIDFGAIACFWDHRSGLHPTSCLWTGHLELGFGTFIGLSASANIGDIINSTYTLNMWDSDPGAFGAHLDGSGSVQVAGVGPSVYVGLDFSSNPLGLSGTAHLTFCACLGSLDIHVGASWYDSGGIHLNDAGIGLSGPCGGCNPANWF